LKIRLDENVDILLESSKDKQKIVFSTKIKCQEGKIFLTSLELVVDQVDLIISQLVTLRANLKKYV
jgi:hypothetical protein